MICVHTRSTIAVPEIKALCTVNGNQFHQSSAVRFYVILCQTKSLRAGAGSSEVLTHIQIIDKAAMQAFIIGIAYKSDIRVV